MSSPLRIGIAGLGTVGVAVIRLLDRQAETLTSRTGRQIIVPGVTASRRSKERGIDFRQFKWFADCTTLAKSPDLDLFVELIGGADGAALVSPKAALRAANPASRPTRPCSPHMECGWPPSPRKKVSRSPSRPRSPAASRSSRPCAKVSPETRSSASMASSTAPAIISSAGWRREELYFAQCLAEAQRLGYAEADPAFDIGGFDTAHKLAS